jgi:C4-dicarboxylate-specific signal transduction histidine kinase
MTFLRYWPQILLSVAVAGLLAWAGGQVYRAGYNAANVRAERIIGEFAKAEAEAQAKAREAERRAVERIAEIEAVQAAQQERIESEVEARTRDLRAGNLRLRREIAALATASVSREAAATAESEAAAARGAELVAAAIGVGAACDARVQSLIEAYEATP